MPALPGCHTQAQSLDQLMERVQEAIALYLEVEGDSPVNRTLWVFKWWLLRRRPSARSLRVRLWLMLPRKDPGNPLTL
nr:type II toxin-antitoxin system HicB family antitoxin [Cyanobium sp. BA20m-p-22]